MVGCQERQGSLKTNATMKLDLMNTKEILINEGWTQGSYCCTAGRCLVGALATATCESWGNAEDGKAGELLLSCTDGSKKLLVDWNDVKGRTKDDVLSLIDKAISTL